MESVWKDGGEKSQVIRRKPDVGYVTRATQHLREVFFGALFVMSKDASLPKNWAYILVIFESFQYLEFFFYEGSHLPWNLSIAGWCEQVLSILELHIKSVFSGTPTSGFNALIFILIVAVLFMLLDSYYLGYSVLHNRVGAMWNVKFLRMIAHLLIHVLYVPIVTLMVEVLDCRVNSGDACYTGVGLLEAILIILIAPGFIAFSIFVVSVFFDQDPTSDNVLAMAHGRVEAAFACTKTVLIFAFVIFHDAVFHWLLIVLLYITSLYLLYARLYFVPFYNHRMNQIQVGFAVMYVWTAVCLTLVKFNNNSYTGQEFTLLFFLTAPMAAGFGFFLTTWRMNQIATEPTDQITKPYLVEVKMRLLLQPTHRSKRPHLLPLFDDENPADSAASDQNRQQVYAQVEKMYRESTVRFRDSATPHLLLTLHYTIYLKLRHLAMIELTRAEEKLPDLDDSFRIYRHKKLADESVSAGGKMDVLAYVSYKKHSSQSKLFNLRARKKQIEFWKEMLHPNPSLDRLDAIGTEINSFISKAQSHYLELIKINSKSPSIHRSYARFLMDVVNDQVLAEEYLSKAQKLEEAKTKALFDSTTNSLDIFDEENGVLSVSTKLGYIGMILSTNTAVTRVFGYARGEMVGRPVTTLLSPVLSNLYDMELSRFALQGKSPIVGTTRSVLGLHKAGYVFSMLLNVKEIADIRTDLRATPDANANTNDEPANDLADHASMDEANGITADEQTSLVSDDEEEEEHNNKEEEMNSFMLAVARAIPTVHRLVLVNDQLNVIGLCKYAMDHFGHHLTAAYLEEHVLPVHNVFPGLDLRKSCGMDQVKTKVILGDGDIAKIKIRVENLAMDDSAENLYLITFRNVKAISQQKLKQAKNRIRQLIRDATFSNSSKLRNVLGLQSRTDEDHNPAATPASMPTPYPADADRLTFSFGGTNAPESHSAPASPRGTKLLDIDNPMDPNHAIRHPLMSQSLDFSRGNSEANLMSLAKPIEPSLIEQPVDQSEQFTDDPNNPQSDEESPMNEKMESVDFSRLDSSTSFKDLSSSNLLNHNSSHNLRIKISSLDSSGRNELPLPSPGTASQAGETSYLLSPSHRELNPLGEPVSPSRDGIGWSKFRFRKHQPISPVRYMPAADDPDNAMSVLTDDNSMAKALRRKITANNQKGSRSIALLRRYSIYVVIVTLAMTLCVLFLTSVQWNRFQDRYGDMQSSALRTFYASTVLFFSRSLLLIKDGLLPSSLDHAVRESLMAAATDLKTVHTQLYQSRTTEYAKQTQLYTANTLTAKSLVSGSIVSSKVNLWSLGITVVSDASTLYSYSYANITSDKPLIYELITNTYETLLPAFELSTQYYKDSAEQALSTLFLSQLLITVLTVVSLAAALLIFFLPSFRQTWRERHRVLSLLVEIPKMYVSDMRQQCLEAYKSFKESELADDGDDAQEAIEDLDDITLTANVDPMDLLNQQLEGHRRKKTNSLVGMRLWGNYVILFVVVVAFFAGTLLWVIDAQQTGHVLSTELYYAIRRPSLIRELHYDLREYLVTTLNSTGQLYADETKTYSIANSTAASLETIQEELMFGSTADDLPGTSNRLFDQDKLMFQDGCVNATVSTACQTFYGGIMSHGVHPAIQQYLRSFEALTYSYIVQEAALTASNTKTLANMINVWNSSYLSDDYNVISTLDSTYLLQALLYSNDLYAAGMQSFVDTFLATRQMVVLVFIVVLVLGLLVVELPYLYKLDDELRNTRSILLMVPNDLLQSVYGIRKLINEILEQEF
eukprot:GILK01006550.1.p1 GENE.GILK01006550.1~~GILK01006550.1.p1  ORF type:complete len:1762 (+),score=338.24 GILK01006550.1:171-5456(+)